MYARTDVCLPSHHMISYDIVRKTTCAHDKHEAKHTRLPATRRRLLQVVWRHCRRHHRTVATSNDVYCDDGDWVSRDSNDERLLMRQESVHQKQQQQQQQQFRGLRKQRVVWNSLSSSRRCRQWTKIPSLVRRQDKIKVYYFTSDR